LKIQNSDNITALTLDNFIENYKQFVYLKP
jgi:hypothetical protein